MEKCDESCRDREFRYLLSVVSDCADTFAMPVVITLFVIIAYCEKLNRTIGLLFLSSIISFTATLPQTVTDIAHGKVTNNYADVLIKFGIVFSNLCQDVYIYLRCAHIISAISNKKFRKTAIHLGLWFLVMADTGSLITSLAINDNNNYQEFIHNLQLWSSTSLDFVSCVIILYAIRATYCGRHLNQKGTASDKRIYRHVQASRIRIAVILFLTIVVTVVLSVVPDSAYGKNGNLYSSIFSEYFYTLQTLMLLIDACMLLLYDPERRDLDILPFSYSSPNSDVVSRSQQCQTITELPPSQVFARSWFLPPSQNPMATSEGGGTA